MSSESDQQIMSIWNADHPLANFFPSNTTIRGGRLEFPTTEHFYQWAKFLPSEKELREQILQADSPMKAKEIAGANSEKVRPDWEKWKRNIMKGIIRLKIKQHPEIVKELLNTGDNFIFEDAGKFINENSSPEAISSAKFWGIYNGEGENMIGEILMELRKEAKTGKL